MSYNEIFPALPLGDKGNPPRSTNVDGTGSTGAQGGPYAEAERQLGVAFPNCIDIIPTEATGFRCGLYSIHHSIKHQFTIKVPTIEELLEIATKGKVAANIREAQGEIDDNNFSADHLAAVVEGYGNMNNHP